LAVMATDYRGGMPARRAGNPSQYTKRPIGQRQGVELTTDS